MTDPNTIRDAVAKALCKGPSCTWDALTKLELGECSRGHALETIRAEVELIAAELMASLDTEAAQAENALLHTEVDSLKEKLTQAKFEAACAKQQRDTLLEMTWLDLPGEPHESTATWREQFNRGWIRKDEGQNDPLLPQPGRD